MPSNYAHHHFGNCVWRSMPPKLRQYAQADRALFAIGQHGPDLLFYYMAMGRNPVNSVGYDTHDRTGTDFFTCAARAWESAGQPPEMLAYLLGVVCHFTLDAACHGYVERKIQASGESHTKIETEFDRYLMVANGLDPLRHRLTGHIQPSNFRAAMIAPVYPPVKPEEVLHALWAMKFYDGLLTGSSRCKRGLLDAGLRLTGNYESMHHLMIGRKPAATCADSNLRLKKLLDRAVPEAKGAMEDFLTHCFTRKSLPEFFNRTFGAGEGWTQIPVLPYEEEVHYEI